MSVFVFYPEPKLKFFPFLPKYKRGNMGVYFPDVFAPVRGNFVKNLQKHLKFSLEYAIL